MALQDDAKNIISHEETVLASVYDSLRSQRSRDVSRFGIENERARALTSQMVGAQRVEDKAMLASDEAVSHTLSDQKKRDVSTIDTLLKKPYFARIELQEEDQSGKVKVIEYKLGTAANPDCRIVDWRKAPIAKLYYEYKEGDEYSEEILGKERTGRVAVRNTLDIEKESLSKVVCRLGTFEREGGDWIQRGDASERRTRRVAGELPEILSLITAEQFRMITEDAESAILIQGIAGSGKTTVALHRLAWLLHEENSPLKPAEAIVVVLSNVLKGYITRTLPKLEVHHVRVLTFKELAAETLCAQLPHLVESRGVLRRPADGSGRGIERVKKSMAILHALEEFVRKNPNSLDSYEQTLVKILSEPNIILENDETGLIDKELIKATRERTIQNIEHRTIDSADDALLLRLIELRTGNLNLKDGTPGRYGHIVIDEVQDCSPVELACVVGGVKNPKDLTIVGDTSQRLDPHSTFPGWDKLRERWAFKDSMSRYMSLTVSHRSTLPIMKLADHIQGRDLVTEGRPGRVPIWFRCRKESDGIGAARDWLYKAMEKYPGNVTAVLCRDNHEAKFVVSLLAPTFGGAVRLGDELSFSFDEGIIVAPIKAVKGLEFTNVLIWNPSERTYPAHEETRNALYVAATRAEENLCIVSWARPSSVLPSFNSPLVRGIDMTPEEEDA